MMKASEIINEMFKQSPLQKEWKPAEGDVIYNLNTKKLYFHIKGVSYSQEYIWLPCQEDLQNIYWNQPLCIVDAYDMPGEHEITSKLLKISDTFGDLSTYEVLNDIRITEPIVEGLNILSYDKRFTLIWCLFIHQEVAMDWYWGKSTAKWDWKKNVWIKNDR
jgi:hypothetical protein